MMEKDCSECGPGLYWEDQEIVLLGLDVVALFPSMQSRNTGKIIRQYVLQSPLKIDGFDWREGARYIVINKEYTGDLKCIWNVLPWRRETNGTAPGMKAKELNSKKGNVEKQWQFPRATPTPTQIREIQARCAEIGTRFLFQNFTYKFNKETYQQTSGGPIGARVTMAAARIVMNDWGAKWKEILRATSVITAMLDGYVDDVRHESTSLRMGTRWDAEKKTFNITETAKAEDLHLKYEMHETSNARMVRICLPAINSINPDLEFTAEIPEEFPDSKLPTLDFFLWLTRHGLLNHSYYQKSSKTKNCQLLTSSYG